jgi:hypothetical protein
MSDIFLQKLAPKKLEVSLSGEDVQTSGTSSLAGIHLPETSKVKKPCKLSYFAPQAMKHARQTGGETNAAMVLEPQRIKSVSTSARARAGGVHQTKIMRAALRHAALRLHSCKPLQVACLPLLYTGSTRPRRLRLLLCAALVIVQPCRIFFLCTGQGRPVL